MKNRTLLYSIFLFFKTFNNFPLLKLKSFQINLKKDKTFEFIEQLFSIDIATKAKFSKKPLKSVDFQSDEVLDKRKIGFALNKKGKFNNLYLVNGNLLIVGNYSFMPINEVSRELTNHFVSIFSTYGHLNEISD